MPALAVGDVGDDEFRQDDDVNDIYKIKPVRHPQKKHRSHPGALSKKLVSQTKKGTLNNFRSISYFLLETTRRVVTPFFPEAMSHIMSK